MSNIYSRTGHLCNTLVVTLRNQKGFFTGKLTLECTLTKMLTTTKHHTDVYADKRDKQAHART